MNDIMAVFNSYLIGKARFTKWKTEFDKNFYKPMGDMMLQAALKNIMTNGPMMPGRMPNANMPQQQVNRNRGV